MDEKKMTGLLKNRLPGLIDASGRYAVLVPVVKRPTGDTLLYEVRSSRLQSQPGEVCFPGGRMEKGETIEECALREAYEELNLPPDKVQILGQLDFLAPRGNFLVHPVLAVIDGDTADALIPSEDEVEEIFEVALDWLPNTRPVEYSYTLKPEFGDNFPYDDLGIDETYNWRHGVEEGPSYHWQDKIIWGMTGKITRHLLRLLEKIK